MQVFEGTCSAKVLLESQMDVLLRQWFPNWVTRITWPLCFLVACFADVKNRFVAVE